MSKKELSGRAFAELVQMRLEIRAMERREKVEDWLPHDWRKVEDRHPCKPPREKVTLRVDQDVLRWFRKKGVGYQAQVNAVLRAYMLAHQAEMLG